MDLPTRFLSTGLVAAFLISACTGGGGQAAASPRFDLWTAQLLVDAATRDAAAVRGDVFTLGYIRNRILHALHPADLTAMNIQLGRLQIASVDGASPRAIRVARKLRAVTAALL
jgi:hypothetical protein